MKDYIKQVDVQYNKKINKQCTKILYLLNKIAFLKIKKLTLRYILDKFIF